MNQLEELDNLRKVLYSETGWGTQNVNQNGKKWEVLGQQSAQYSSTSNNGTDFWEISLRIKRGEIPNCSSNWGEGAAYKSAHEKWGDPDNNWPKEQAKNTWGQSWPSSPLPESQQQQSLQTQPTGQGFSNINQLLDSILDLKGALDVVQENLCAFQGNWEQLPEPIYYNNRSNAVSPSIQKEAMNLNYFGKVWTDPPKTNVNDWPKATIEENAQPKIKIEETKIFPSTNETEVWPTPQRFPATKEAAAWPIPQPGNVLHEPIFSSSIWSFNPNDSKHFNEADDWNQSSKSGNKNTGNTLRPILGSKANKN